MSSDIDAVAMIVVLMLSMGCIISCIYSCCLRGDGTSVVDGWCMSFICKIETDIWQVDVCIKQVSWYSVVDGWCCII